MTHPISDRSREFFIQGITHDGRAFRPSDWAERLCGIMACFRPVRLVSTSRHLQYSPYVRPIMVGNVKCVVVNEELHAIEPRAYEFVLGFAKDNDLVMEEACLLPDHKET